MVYELYDGVGGVLFQFRAARPNKVTEVDNHQIELLAFFTVERNPAL